MPHYLSTTDDIQTLPTNKRKHYLPDYMKNILFRYPKNSFARLNTSIVKDIPILTPHGTHFAKPGLALSAFKARAPLVATFTRNEQLLVLGGVLLAPRAISVGASDYLRRLSHKGGDHCSHSTCHAPSQRAQRANDGR